ncbi:CDP-alcohol phosphatidyltransferase family protein [uncultured Alistipes sp.]|uniref:CDP-alcohol phosphatidyltransferase family protein n=1 Tax=uncultured Alistipes sp. TaxID=538949 RepID=UPI0025E80F7F|nr:CDP-alcohol phosphatidyltransferase family protein [uncultured Alistipes sp.]
MKIKLFTIPNLLTLSNLLCGSFAVVSALVYGNLVWAFWLIVIAAVFDFFDGFVARLLKSSSPLGVQLDSLSDMISFGFAPAAVLFVLYGEAPDGVALNESVLAVGRYAVFILTAFSALRLAKFNIDETQHTEFQGLNTPACTLFCVSLGLLSVTEGLVLNKIAILLIVAVMSYLLVSPIRMFAFKFNGFGWKGNELRYGFIILSIVLLALLRAKAVPVIILLYIVVSVIRWIVMLKRRDPKAYSGK